MICAWSRNGEEIQTSLYRITNPNQIPLPSAGQVIDLLVVAADIALEAASARVARGYGRRSRASPHSHSIVAGGLPVMS
jgi:hypothetical protein